MNVSGTGVIAALALAWCWPAFAGHGSHQPSPSCLEIEVSSTPAAGSQRGTPRFSSKEVLDLNFEVLFAESSRFESGAGLQLRLYTPNGFLYRETGVPIAADGSGERERFVPGRRHAFEVKRAHGYGRQGRRVRAVPAPPLMVAGTDIMLSSLYGTWRVEAWPDGASRACMAKFTIVP
jgi:hypothetical protein